MANILESYKNRLAISESVHKNFHGSAMSPAKKTMVAACLNNMSRFMNEAFDSSAATNRGTLSNYKRFCLNVATTALPTLILPDLMLTQPMSSISGYVTYMNYTAGTTKGGVEAGDFFNGAYRIGEMTENRINYTSSRVVEAVEDFTSGTSKVHWTPVNVEAGFKLFDAKDAEVEGTIAKDGTITSAGAVAKVAYVYDNIEIPQKVEPTSIPTLTGKMDAIELHAHARRIAIYYSQIAAFQAKTDYGFDLGQQLATQAQGELAFEIDSEGVKMLVDGAEADATINFKHYDENIDNAKYISRSQYYEGFAEIVNKAKMVIYNRTQKFAPNYMIIGSGVLPILPYLKGWKAAPAATVNGPFFAGTLDGLKVYVSPAMKAMEYVFGVNGSDLQTSAAVYAPYMPIVPTQLLGFSDGTMTQGFSTMYDMKLLATYNRDGDKVVDAPRGTGKFSYLLVKGELTVA